MVSILLLIQNMYKNKCLMHSFYIIKMDVAAVFVEYKMYQFGCN